DFESLRDQITSVVTNAEFNGLNLLGAGATGFSALANAEGTGSITVEAEVMALGGAIVTVAATQTIDTMTDATDAMSDVNDSIENVSAALARLGTKSKSLETHANFVSKLSDTLEAGIGNLVDADLARESARLQA